jgi:hypothetical protein
MLRVALVLPHQIANFRFGEVPFPRAVRLGGRRWLCRLAPKRHLRAKSQPVSSEKAVFHMHVVVPFVALVCVCLNILGGPASRAAVLQLSASGHLRVLSEYVLVDR